MGRKKTLKLIYLLNRKETENKTKTTTITIKRKKKQKKSFKKNTACVERRWDYPAALTAFKVADSIVYA